MNNDQTVTSKRVMMQCKTLVNKDAVRRESIDGIEHVIISSSTLPDDIVMNGGLYPADEIAKSFESLELTLAPVEHPTDGDGNFISANDPRAIHGFHAGAFNVNVRREDGRVHIDKFINVSEAMKTDRGKRLLDRINELESNSEPRPIHTSVGVFLITEALDEPQTNAAGDEFTWIARDMVFDHDAILLDSVGAAQPHQGVGVAVNHEGEETEVQRFSLNNETTPPSDEEFDRLKLLYGNQEGMSFDQIRQSVMEALERSAIDADWIEELFDDRVIFWSKDELFEVPFVIDDEGISTIVGIPLPVERNVTFTPKTNHSEGDAMRELMLKALAGAEIAVNTDISDDELLAKYNELQANQSEGDDNGDTDDNGDLASVVANAVAEATKPLVSQMEGLESKLNSAGQAKLNRLAELIGNSDKYPGLDADAAKKLGIEKLEEMAANCTRAYGLSPVLNSDGSRAESTVPKDMPE